MIKNLIFIVFAITTLSCKNDKKETTKMPLKPNEILLIENFAEGLTNSINKYEYDFIRKAWNAEIFRQRVSGLNNTEQTVFNHYYDKELSHGILNTNIDFVNKLKFSNGKITLSQTDLFSNYVEITYSLIFGESVDFWKYRIEISNGKPYLTDFYSFRDDIWQSQNMKNVIRLNSKYTAVSNERREANRSLSQSQRALVMRDTLLALEYLYEIPETHLIGNGLSLKKINLAQTLHDSILAQVVYTEYELNKNIYIKYLYGYYFNDTLILNEVFSDLESKVGNDNSLLDSMKTMNYLWK